MVLAVVDAVIVQPPNLQVKTERVVGPYRSNDKTLHSDKKIAPVPDWHLGGPSHVDCLASSAFKLPHPGFQIPRSKPPNCP